MKSAGEIFLSGLRGAKNVSNAFRIVFRILFRVFQTVFRIDKKKTFGGSFVLQTCRPIRDENLQKRLAWQFLQVPVAVRTNFPQFEIKSFRGNFDAALILRMILS